MNTKKSPNVSLVPVTRYLLTCIYLFASLLIFSAAYKLIPLPVPTDCKLLFCGSQAWQLKGIGLIFLVVAGVVAIMPAIKRIHAILLVVAVVFMLVSVFSEVI